MADKITDMAGAAHGSSLNRRQTVSTPTFVLTDRDDNIIVSAITTIEQFMAMKDRWLCLEDTSDGALLFQSWHWNREYFEHAELNGSSEPFILCAHDGDELVALLPLAIQNKKALRVLTGLSEPFQQYTEMLVTRGHNPKTIFKKWITTIKSAKPDYVHLGQVRDDGNLKLAIDGVIQPTGEADAAPCVAIGNWETFDDYYATLKSKTRKNMRNARNRLEKQAPVSHEVHREGAGLAEIIDHTYEAREAWLERMGITSRAFSDTDFEAFLERFKNPASGNNGDHPQTIAMALKHGDHPIAEQWGFIYKGCYYAYISGWDENYEQSSPGKLHLGAVLEACFEAGLEKADFLMPAVPYKATWATGEVGVQDYVLPLSIRGYIFNGLWLNILRPLAKTIILKLPKSLRSILVSQIVSRLR